MTDEEQIVAHLTAELEKGEGEIKICGDMAVWLTDHFTATHKPDECDVEAVAGVIDRWLQCGADDATGCARAVLASPAVASNAEKDARIAELEAALAKATQPEWFYDAENMETCHFSPCEVIEYVDPDKSCIVEVETATRTPTIFCAVIVTDDEDADERWTHTEHATRAEAEAALAAALKGAAR